MAKLTRPPKGGKALPPDVAPMRITGVVHTRLTKSGLKLRVWPKKRPHVTSPATLQAMADFKQMVSLVNQVPAWDRTAATVVAHNSGWTWRDVLSKCVTGHFWEVPGLEASAVPFILDTLSSVRGAILYRGDDGWIGLVPAGDGKVITIGGGLPQWVDASTLAVGITQLHGAVIAGPGTGNQSATLATTGVAAGTYTNCTVTVTADGRITSAASGAVATTATPGVVKPDGTTITIDGTGKITATATTPGIATVAANGVSRPDGSTIVIDASGKLTVVTGAGAGIFAPAMSVIPTSATTGLTNWSNQGGATVSDSGAGIAIAAPNAGGASSLRTRYKTAPSTPYRATALLALASLAVNQYQAAHFGWFDGTKYHTLTVQFRNQSAATYTNPGIQLYVNRFSNATTYVSSDFLSGGSVPNPIWLRLRDDGTTVYFQWSADGVNFVTLYSIAKSSGYLGSSGYSRLFFAGDAINSDTIATLMSYAETP